MCQAPRAHSLYSSETELPLCLEVSARKSSRRKMGCKVGKGYLSKKKGGFGGYSPASPKCFRGSSEIEQFWRGCSSSGTRFEPLSLGLQKI